jgi:hypothetical protein
MFRRGFRRGALRRAMQPDVPPVLQRAHELMTSGNYPAAAEAFEQLARAGEARQHPKTAQMYLQAGRARILAGQKETGFAHLKRGLSLMAEHPVQLQRAGGRVINELNEQGMSTEAQEIVQWLKTSLPPAPNAIGVRPETRSGAPVASARKPILPTNCPSCGGIVRADDIDWLDDVTAECNWCGSAVRAEG